MPTGKLRNTCVAENKLYICNVAVVDYKQLKKTFYNSYSEFRNRPL